MFGLKIFVPVQTFRRVPPVLPRNFCHPGVQKSLKHGQIAQEEHLKHMWKKHLHGETHEEPAEWAKCLWTSSVTGALGWGPRWWRECWKMSKSETQRLIQLTRTQVWWRQGNWKAPCWKPTHQQGGRPAQKIIPLRNLSRAFLKWVVCYSECESWWVLVCLGESGRLLPALKVDLTCGWESGELPAGWPWGFRRQGDLLQATWWRLWSVWAWWTMWTWPIRWTGWTWSSRWTRWT